MLVFTIAMLLIPAGAVDEDADQNEVTTEEVTSEEVVYEFNVYDAETAGVALAAISDNYGVGTSHVSIFAGMVGKLPLGHHYVYYRDGQYDYVLAHSDSLVYDGGMFSAADATIVTYTTSGSYQSQPTFTVSSDSDFQLDPADYLVWSDLGEYPDLIDRGEVQYEALGCFILCSFAVWIIFDRFVRACKRSR